MANSIHNQLHRVIIATALLAFVISGCTVRLDEPLIIRGVVTEEKNNVSVPVEAAEITVYDLRGWPLSMPTVSKLYTQKTNSKGFYQFEIVELKGTFLDIGGPRVPCQYDARPVGELGEMSTIFDKQ